MYYSINRNYVYSLELMIISCSAFYVTPAKSVTLLTICPIAHSLYILAFIYKRFKELKYRNCILFFCHVNISFCWIPISAIMTDINFFLRI